MGGNFANDRTKASETGRKGGETTKMTVENRKGPSPFRHRRRR
ncbi:KGG domain-containing protein [Pseudomonas sp. NPDC087615]